MTGAWTANKPAITVTAAAERARNVFGAHHCRTGSI